MVQDSECPFCTIPERETLLYSDSLVYLVKTKDMKGHLHRVTAATRRHTATPTFEEWVRVYTVLYDYMSRLGLPEWYITDSTHARWPDHYHKVACDGFGTIEELELLAKTEKAKFPLRRDVMIGIPAHNEVEHIASIVEAAKEYGDVWVYDDGSTDGTAAAAGETGAFVVKGMENKGYGYALRELFKFARCNNYEVLVTLDGDGQHDPTEIPKFLDALKQADVVLGNRFTAESDTPAPRKAVVKTLSKLYDVGDSQCGFRAYNRRAIEKIQIKDMGMGASLDILNQIKNQNLRIAEIPCTITYEDAGHTQGRLKHGMNLLESLFWGTVWRRPYTYLGIPSLLLFLFSVFCGGMLLHLYQVSKYFVVSYGILMVGSFVTSMCLAIATFFITVQRRLLKEVR